MDIIILYKEFPTANSIIEYLLQGPAFLSRMPNRPMIFAKFGITLFSCTNQALNPWELNVPVPYPLVKQNMNLPYGAWEC